VQDSWRVNRRLTVHLGMRWEVQVGRTERYNRLNNFDFNLPSPLAQQAGLALTGGLVFATADNRTACNTDWSGIAPHFGVAYKIT